jgi:hypothetical protein
MYCREELDKIAKEAKETCEESTDTRMATVNAGPKEETFEDSGFVHDKKDPQWNRTFSFDEMLGKISIRGTPNKFEILQQEANVCNQCWGTIQHI